MEGVLIRLVNSCAQDAGEEDIYMNLTDKDLNCILELALGLPMKMIARRSDVTVRTLEARITTIKKKLQCQRKYEIVSKAIEAGIISAPRLLVEEK